MILKLGFIFNMLTKNYITNKYFCQYIIKVLFVKYEDGNFYSLSDSFAIFLYLKERDVINLDWK